MAAYVRLAEGYAAEAGHADRDPHRAAEVLLNPDRWLPDRVGFGSAVS